MFSIPITDRCGYYVMQFLLGGLTSAIICGGAWTRSALEPTTRELDMAEQIRRKYRDVVTKSSFYNPRNPDGRGISLNGEDFVVPLKMDLALLYRYHLVDPIDRMRFETALANKGLRIWTAAELTMFGVKSDALVSQFDGPGLVEVPIIFRHGPTQDMVMVCTRVSSTGVHSGEPKVGLSDTLFVSGIRPGTYRSVGMNPKTVLMENVVKYFCRRPFMGAAAAVNEWMVFVRPFSYRRVPM